MNVYPEYRDYNLVTVKIIDYIVSNISTKSKPEEIQNVELQSVSFQGPVLGGESSNQDSVSATGTVTLVDYKHSIFNLLSGYLGQFMDGVGDAKVSELCPKIEITISCYTGTKQYNGNIIDWSMSYQGSASIITINWSVIVPSDAHPDPLPAAYYKTPGALIKKAREKYNTENIDFIFHDGDKEYKNDSVGSKLQFPNGSVYFDLSKVETTKNKLLDSYIFIIRNATTSNGNPLYGNIDEKNNNLFHVYSKTPKDNAIKTEDSKACSGLVFIQNGKFPAYSKKDNRLVIPIVSYSTDFKSTQLALQGNIRGNFNGNFVSTGNTNALTAGPVSETNNSTNSGVAAQDPVTTKFECYNVMVFDTNNNESTIAIEVYDEYGTPVTALSTHNAMVRSVNYEISGAVVKASVECCTHFNLNNAKVSDTQMSGFSGDSDSDVSSGSISGSNSSSTSSSANASDMTNYKSYLCSEDAVVTSLSNDRTVEWVNNGAFDDLVNNLLNTYQSNKTLEYSFIETLKNNNCYGLIVLLLSVANYGIKNVPNEVSNKIIDAVCLLPDYKNKPKFFASPTGKGPFDYKAGGLGIAHWDAENFKDIYSSIGFSSDLTSTQKEHFKNLLTTNNSIAGWESFVYKGQPRIRPVYAKDPIMREFNNGLLKDSEWLQWAHDILYFRTTDGVYIYQNYLFRLWVKKFWEPTIYGLKKSYSTPSHKIGLQDAARIARAGNTATSLIKKSLGKTVAQQYEIYKGDKERYIRQKAFCRRCADLIGAMST
jgi:hypothetical protein